MYWLLDVGAEFTGTSLTSLPDILSHSSRKMAPVGLAAAAVKLAFVITLKFALVTMPGAMYSLLHEVANNAERDANKI